jgi:hypothetical protein
MIMQFDSFNIDQVFNNFVSNMKESGSLNRPAKYTMPESILGSVGTKDIDISDELRKKAEKGASKMYGLFSDDVVGDAHNGSVKVVDAAGDLGVVETIQDAHKKIEDVATKKVKIAKEVIALAQKLDDARFFKLANRLDAALSEFLNIKAASNREYENALDKINQLVISNMPGSDKVVAHYRNDLLQNLEQLLYKPSASSLRNFSKKYYSAALHLGKLPEGKEVAQAMYNSYADLLELVSSANAALSQASNDSNIAKTPLSEANA